MVGTLAPAVTLRPMTYEDIPQVHALDRLAFPTPWPMNTYRHEINGRNSLMFVLEFQEPPQQSLPEGPISLMRRLLNRIPPSGHGAIIGFSGMWHVADEAHVSTIGVHPDWQGMKFGEMLLWNMMRYAFQRRAAMMTLEVRVSNEKAQALYYKYGFEIGGRRKAYYRDNGEDAYLMIVQPLNAEYRAWLVERGRELQQLMRVSDRTRGYDKPMYGD